MPTRPDQRALEVECLPSLRDITPAAWDAMAGGDVLWEHGWLVSLEQALGPHRRPWYVVLRHGTDLLAAAACQKADRPGTAWIERQVFGRGAGVAHRCGAGLAPLLAVGSRFGITAPICVHPDQQVGTREELGGLVLDRLLVEATRERRSVLVFGVEHGAWIQPLLDGRGLRQTLDYPSTRLAVTWPDFEGYLRTLGQTHRNMPGAIRNERSRARRAGVTIERLAHPGPLAPVLHGLLDAHHDRLNRLPFPLGAGIPTDLADRLGDRLVLQVAWRDGQPIGVMLGLMSDQTLDIIGIGIDPRHQRETLLYFVLAYDASVELAVQHGIRRIHCGRMAYAVKRRRGFALQPMHSYVRPRTRCSDPFISVAGWAASLRLRRLLERTA